MLEIKDILYKLLNEMEVEEGIKEELCEKIQEFDNQFTRLVQLKNNMNINIIIDNLSQKKINILLEIILEAIKKYKDDYNIIKYADYKDKDKNSIVIIDDFDMFCSKVIENWNTKERFKKFIKDNRENNNIIIFTCPDNIKRYLEKVDQCVFDINTCIRISGKLDEKNEYKKLIKKIKDLEIEYHLSYAEFKKILDNIKDNEFVLSCSIADYLFEYGVKRLLITNTNVIEMKIYEELIKEEKPKNKIELKNLVGLKNIKTEIDSLCNYAKFIKELKIDKEQTYLNMFFLGNPGTGKTTVARLIAEKLYNLGFLKENDIVEITPNDLIAEYVGQTRAKTRNILKKAEGKLLFIDEAYLLYNSNYTKGNNPFMDEAIVELVKYIEDPKNIVIFAGYTNEMKKIYEANPGIKSRIYKEINFLDYTITELYKILNNDLINKGLIIDKKSKQNIINYIKQLKNNKDFGNARNMKQLSQQLLINHSNRKIKTKIIDKEDLPILNNSKTRIGFGEYYG